MKKLVLLAMVVCIAFTALSCEDKSDDTIKIGAIFPLSGRVALFGTESRDGGILAVEQINAAGGILGRQLAIVAEDDEGDAALSINAFQRLTTRERVQFIFGSSTSGATKAITDRAQAAGVLVITPSATAIDITAAGDFIFRACFIDPFQGVVSADFAFNELGLRRAAVLFDNGGDYNTGLAEAFRDRLEQLGGQVVAWESYMTDDKDFSAQVTRIRTANPEIVFLPNYYNDVVLQAVQLRDQGVTVPLLGGDGWDGVIDNAGDEVVGSFWVSAFAADTTDPTAMEFVQAFEARFNRPASQFSALGYDSIMMLAEAMRAAGSTEPAAVRDALMKTDGTFVTGRIRFDENRNPIKSASILEIVRTPEGRLANVYRTTVNP